MARGSGRTFASLGVYNYRIWFFAAMASNIGTWIGRTAQSWLVLMILTEQSAFHLGNVTALQFGPMLFLAPWGGVIADRFDKRHILIVTQALLGVQQLIQWVLVATGACQLWHVYLLAIGMACITAVDNPARQAFASEMVGPELLSNAVGLNSASFNTARLIGPAVAGLLIAWLGVAPAMLLNGLSFGAVIVGLAMMHPAELHPAPRRRGRGSFREGVAYVRHRPDIILTLAILFIFSAFALNYQITNILMATQVYHKGAAEYGVLGSIMAIGSLTAALLAARRERPRFVVMMTALFVFTLVDVALGLAPSYLVYCVMLVPIGMTSILLMNTANARVQLSVEPQFRGRVMSLYFALFMGASLIGAPIIGWIGDTWGPRWTVLVGAISSALTLVVVTIYLRLTKQLDRVRFRAAVADLPLPRRRPSVG